MTDSLADRLLEAQTRWVVAQLSAESVSASVPQVVDDLLAVAEQVTLEDVVDPETVAALGGLLAARLPGSAVGSTVTHLVADLVHEGPPEPILVGELVDRDHLEVVVDELLAHTDVLEGVLDTLTRSPQMAALAARFTTLLVREVVATNRAVAERIPGVGGLLSFGASTAGRVAGVADRQIDALVGGTAGRGAVLAMRGLNRVLIDTLRDPAARAAILDVHDLYADQPLGRVDEALDLDDVHRLAGLAQDALIAHAPAAPVAALADRLVRGVLEVYGAEPLATFLADLGLTRDDVVVHARAAAPRVLAAAVGSGEVERLVRTQLAPFYASPEVAEILGATGVAGPG